MVDQKKVNRRQVDSIISRIVNSLSLCTPTLIKYESVFHKLIKAGLEWIKPLQDELAEDAVAVRQKMKQIKEVLKHHQETGLPKEQTLPVSRPLSATRLDILDSVNGKAAVNEKAEMKVYPLLLVYRSTGAVHTRVALDFSTSAFMLQWSHCVAIRGGPTKVVSNQGSQLTPSDGTSKINLLNWEQVKGQEARRKTDWEFVPAGCQWRNRLAKTRVKTL